MRILIVCFGLMIGLDFVLFSQDYGAHPIITDLLTHSEPIMDIHYSIDLPENFFDLRDAPNKHIQEAFQFLLRNEYGLFVLVDGTGRIYQVLPVGDSIRLQRHDSTIYFGYNFGQEFFMFRDTLFSIGGVGFWRVNGHLRHYSPDRHEWEIEKLNMELPITRTSSLNCFLWLDTASGKFYKTGFDTNAPALISNRNETRYDDRVAVLDLKTREWTVLGTLENRIGYRVCSTPWGEVALDDEGKTTAYLLDFSKNELLRLDPEKTRMIYSYSNNPYKTTTLVYYRDSSICFGRMNPPAIFKIFLTQKNFSRTGMRIYKPIPNGLEGFSKSATGKIVVWSIPLALLVVLAVRIYGKKLRSEQLQVASNGQGPLFSDRETALIQIFLKNEFQNYSASIDEVNLALGLSLKNPEVQKKHRSDIILSINQKYKLKAGSDEALINKERTQDDKRSYTYFLNHKKYKQLKGLFNGGNYGLGGGG